MQLALVPSLGQHGSQRALPGVTYEQRNTANVAQNSEINKRPKKEKPLRYKIKGRKNM